MSFHACREDLCRKFKPNEQELSFDVDATKVSDIYLIVMEDVFNCNVLP